MKKGFIILCFLVSGVLVYLSFSNFTEKALPKPTFVRFKYDSTQFSLNYFDDNYRKNGISAIGVISALTCAGCTNELFEFSVLIDKVENRFFNGDYINKFFVVTGGDSSSARRFKKVHHIDENVYFLKRNTQLEKTLTAWNEERVANQWIFVNNRSSTIFSRILVLSSLTSLSFKRGLLNRAIFTGNVNIKTNNN